MDSKSMILSIFMENKNKYISGETIANKLNVTRTAIWQSIKKLQSEGHNIKSTTNKGYLFIEKNILTKEGIEHYIDNKYKNINIKFFDKINSTNKQAKIDAANIMNEYTIYITPYQTDGYGRFGRGFVGDKFGGIYMSIIIKPKVPIKNIPLITIKTAVAEKISIDKIAKIDTKIKWVNDLYYKNKKISGILTEAVTDYETGTISTIIIGIGINFNIKKFPLEIQNIAGNIFDKVPKNITSNMLVGDFINTFFDTYLYMSNDEIISIYKNASFVLGQEIYFVQKDIKYSGKALDISDNGELVVQLKNGKIINLFSGEISIKLI